jgi:hypothetical protein
VCKPMLGRALTGMLLMCLSVCLSVMCRCCFLAGVCHSWPVLSAHQQPWPCACTCQNLTSSCR